MKTTFVTSCVLLLLISSLLLVDGGIMGKHTHEKPTKKVIVGPLFASFIDLENFASYHSQVYIYIEESVRIGSCLLFWERVSRFHDFAFPFLNGAEAKLSQFSCALH